MPQTGTTSKAQEANVSTATPEATAAAQELEQSTQEQAAPAPEAPKPEAPETKQETFDRDYVEKLRQEAAENRTKARDAEKQAKDEADARVKAILEAAGIKTEGDEDPEAAAKAQAEQNASRAEAAEAERDQAKRELAIYKQANKSGADTDLLLDSTSFLNATKDISPDDAEAIETAIKKALETNPRFKSAQAAGQSGADFNGGTGEGQITQEQFNAYSPSEKNDLFKSNPTLYRKLSGRE